jgi:hypothetical protein
MQPTASKASIILKFEVFWMRVSLGHNKKPSGAKELTASCAVPLTR